MIVPLRGREQYPAGRNLLDDSEMRWSEWLLLAPFVAIALVFAAVRLLLDHMHRFASRLTVLLLSMKKAAELRRRPQIDP